jgi:hypothetical protein
MFSLLLLVLIMLFDYNNLLLLFLSLLINLIILLLINYNLHTVGVSFFAVKHRPWKQYIAIYIVPHFEQSIYIAIFCFGTINIYCNILVFFR